MIIHRSVIAILWLLLSVTFLHGQIHLHDREPYLRSTEIAKLSQEVNDLIGRFRSKGFEITTIDIFKVRDSYFICPDSRLEVYEYSGDTMVNISNSIHFGYNHGAYKFTYRDTLYSLGGYGFWRSHADLIYFDEDKKEWEIVPVRGDKPPGIAASNTFQHEGKIISFLGLKTDQSMVTLKSEMDDVFELDMVTLKWTKTGEVRTEFYSDFIFETDRFLYAVTTPQLILNKENQLIKGMNTTGYHNGMQYLDQYFHQIRGDSVVSYDTNGNIKNTFDLVALYSDFGEEAEPLVASNLYLSTNILVALSIVILLAVGYKLYHSRRITQPAQSKYLEKLLENGDLLITIENLDTLFELDGIISDETRRYRRASIINSLNESYMKIHGRELIKRVKDPEDRRRYLYRVEK